MDVDFLFCQPFHTVGDAERAVDAHQRGDASPQRRPLRRSGRQAVVVVRFREIHETAVSFGKFVCMSQIVFNVFCFKVLEQFGIGPVQTAFLQQFLRGVWRAAETFQEENRIGILFANFRRDILPNAHRHHVACVTAEAIDAQCRPTQKNFRHIFPQIVVCKVQFAEIRPCDAPRSRARKRAVVITAKPFWMPDLHRRCPAGMVCRQVDQHHAAFRMDGVEQFAELFKRRRSSVEHGHARIDCGEVDWRERTAETAHSRKCRGNGMNGQQLHDSKT